MKEVDNILNNWFGESPESSDDTANLLKYLYNPLREIEKQRDAYKESLDRFIFDRVHSHDSTYD